MGEVVRAYRYGCVVSKRFPVEGEADLDRQLRLATDFWNHLVRIHAEHEARRLEVLNSATTEVAALVARRDELTQAIQGIRAAIREQRQRVQGTVPLDEPRARIRALTAERKEVAAALKAARASAHDLVAPALDEITTAGRETRKRARQQAAAAGLYWGTYAVVDQAFVTAARGRRHDGRPAQPRERTYTGAGTIHVQIALERADRPVRISQVMAGRCGVLQIEPIDFSGWSQLGSRQRAVRGRTWVKIRVGTHADRSPAWVRVCMVMHRPLPEAAVLKRASLSRWRVGGQWRYSLSITVREETPEPREGPAVALDLRWRKLDDGGLRAGYWRGQDGAGGEIRVPERVLAWIDEVDRLGSLRHDLAAQAAARLQAWIAELDDPPEWLPAELTAALSGPDGQPNAHPHPSLLARLALTWRARRFPADEAGYGPLEAWRRRDAHLWRWQANLREQAGAARLDHYRKVALALARRYAVVVVEDTDLHEVQQLPRPEDSGEGSGRRQRRNAKVAASGTLRRIVEQTMAREGGWAYRAKATDTSQMHHGCGQLVAADYAAEVRIFCPRCGVWYDVADNACRNLLTRMAEAAPVRPVDAPPASRFRKRRESRGEATPPSA